jgi:protein-disulfide isomerase
MRFTIAAVAALLSIPVLAAPPSIGALESYAKAALPLCPDTKVTVAPTNAAAPAGFVDYEVTATGKDPACNAKKHLLYSPASNQIILGNVVPLPADPRPLQARLSDYATQVMKKDIVATVMPFPLADGLKLATLTKQTDYGPFAYHVYVDGSERFMIIGMRGNLNESPGKTLIDSLGIGDAVRRGNPKAKIEILELSDFECPACGNAHKTIWPTIEKNLSKINFARLDLPLFEHHEWALPAALGGRAVQKVAPAKYWDYVDFMFGNQETIGRQPFDQVLKNWVEDHDIDWAKIEKIYHSDAERQAVMQQVERAFDNSINATPTFILNGHTLSFGPDGSWALAEIKKALGQPATAPKKTAAKKK